MAATPTNVNIGFNYDNVDRTAYTTGTFTPTANKPHTLSVVNYGGGSPPTTLSTTTGLTFTQRATTSTGNRDITEYSAPGVSSPSSGTITAAFDGVSQTGCSMVLTKWDGVDESSTVGDGIEQIKTGVNGVGTTSFSITLNSAVTAGNVTAGSVAHSANENTVPGTDFVELDENAGGTPNVSHQTEWWSAPSDAVVDWSWATNTNCIGIAYEMKSAVAGTFIAKPPLIINQAVNRSNTY